MFIEILNLDGMQRRTFIASIGAVLGTSVGAAAYTNATVARNANINVVTDDSGLIGLGDGTSGDLIDYNDQGGLTIDLTRGSAAGANAEAQFAFGDSENAATAYAFTVTNNDTAARDLTLDYLIDTDPDTTVDYLQFKVYNASDGSPLEEDGTTGEILSVATETSSYTISGAEAGTPYHVVLEIDTTGLSDTADLSGDLEITA